MRTFFRRVIQAARLNAAVYEDVEGDPAAFWQAFLVVALSGIAMVIGITGRVTFTEAISGVGFAYLGWALWSATAFAIGAWKWPERQTSTDWSELLRTTGFACAPGMLGVLGLVPELTGFIALIASVWMVIAFEVAAQHALDYKSREIGRAH